MIASVVAVFLVVAITSCGSGDNKQASSRKAKATTTAPTTTSAVTTTVPTTTTATTQAPSSEPPSTDATTETTAPPPVCLNSTDPRCGEFRWEPPVTNQPITIDSFTVDPPHPISGQTLTVTIQWSDPDADRGEVTVVCNGTGSCLGDPLAPCDPLTLPHGPWAPPPPRPGAGTLTETLYFHDAGTFTWSVGIRSRDSAAGFGCGHPDPYTSGARVSDSITVLPELPPFPSIPQ